jgi:hypothetical protein
MGPFPLAPHTPHSRRNPLSWPRPHSFPVRTLRFSVRHRDLRGSWAADAEGGRSASDSSLGPLGPVAAVPVVRVPGPERAVQVATATGSLPVSATVAPLTGRALSGPGALAASRPGAACGLADSDRPAGRASGPRDRPGRRGQIEATAAAGGMTLMRARNSDNGSLGPGLPRRVVPCRPLSPAAGKCALSLAAPEARAPGPSEGPGFQVAPRVTVLRHPRPWPTGAGAGNGIGNWQCQRSRSQRQSNRKAATA